MLHSPPPIYHSEMNISSVRDTQMTERYTGHPAVAHAQTSRNDKIKQKSTETKTRTKHQLDWYICIIDRHYY